VSDPVTTADPTAVAVHHNLVGGSYQSNGVLGAGTGAVKGVATTLAAPTGFPATASLFAEPFLSQPISSGAVGNINSGGGISGGIFGGRRMSGII
jgi:hypothetical protein